MPLSAGARRDLDQYAATIGPRAVKCRLTGRHDYADPFEDAGRTMPGTNELYVDVTYNRNEGIWQLVSYCLRDCKVRLLSNVDRSTGMISGTSRTDYSEAPEYLRPSGHSGQSGIGPQEKGYMRMQRILGGMARVREMKEHR